jgi:hypothetical protein
MIIFLREILALNKDTVLREVNVDVTDFELFRWFISIIVRESKRKDHDYCQNDDHTLQNDQF